MLRNRKNSIKASSADWMAAYFFPATVTGDCSSKS